MCHREIMKTKNNTAILSSLIRRKSITISSTETLRGCHRSGHISTLKHASTGKELKSILAMPKE
jgi:hypothetical protein